MENSVWAEPRMISSTDDCFFYHTMDIPGHGTVQGEWDLRGREADYLGHIDLKGKRVLEMGTASGHMCFAMEAMGAEVVAYDLSEEQEWDMVLYSGYDHRDQTAQRMHHLRLINNGFWLAHRVFGSRARVAYGTVYGLPEELGKFDVCTFGSILLHLRDPFLALQRAAEHVTGTMVVSDLVPALSGARHGHGGRLVEFLPDASTCLPTDTWWHLSPELVAEFLRILGFPVIRTTLHVQTFQGREAPLYTVVGYREGVLDRKPETDPAQEVVSPGERVSSVLEETALNSMHLSHIARHMVRRIFRGVSVRMRPGRRSSAD